MKWLVLALAFVASSAGAQSRASLAAQARANTQATYLSWTSCLQEAASTYSKGRDAAETVADAAFSKCSQWDGVLKASLVQATALKAYEMPLETAMAASPAVAQHLFNELRSRTKETVVRHVVEVRAKKASH